MNLKNLHWTALIVCSLGALACGGAQNVVVPAPENPADSAAVNAPPPSAEPPPVAEVAPADPAPVARPLSKAEAAAKARAEQNARRLEAARVAKETAARTKAEREKLASERAAVAAAAKTKAAQEAKATADAAQAEKARVAKERAEAAAAEKARLDQTKAEAAQKAKEKADLVKSEKARVAKERAEAAAAAKSAAESERAQKARDAVARAEEVKAERARLAGLPKEIAKLRRSMSVLRADATRTDEWTDCKSTLESRMDLVECAPDLACELVTYKARSGEWADSDGILTAALKHATDAAAIERLESLRLLLASAIRAGDSANLVAASAAFEVGNLKLANGFAVLASKEAPSDWRPLAIRADILAAQKKWAEAAEGYEESRRLAGERAGDLRSRAEECRHEATYRDAAQAAQEAWQRGDLGVVADQLRTAIGLFPTRTELAVMACWAFALTGATEEALAAVDRIRRFGRPAQLHEAVALEPTLRLLASGQAAILAAASSQAPEPKEDLSGVTNPTNVATEAVRQFQNSAAYALQRAQGRETAIADLRRKVPALFAEAQELDENAALKEAEAEQLEIHEREIKAAANRLGSWGGLIAGAVTSGGAAALRISAAQSRAQAQGKRAEAGQAQAQLVRLGADLTPLSGPD